MKALAVGALVLLLSCGGPQHVDVTGRWRVEIHDANSPPPIFTYAFTFDLFSTGEELDGVAYYPLDVAILTGGVNGGVIWFAAESGTYLSNFFVASLQPDGSYLGRVFCGGFSFGVVELRRVQPDGRGRSLTKLPIGEGSSGEPTGQFLCERR